MKFLKLNVSLFSLFSKLPLWKLSLQAQEGFPSWILPLSLQTVPVVASPGPSGIRASALRRPQTTVCSLASLASRSFPAVPGWQPQMQQAGCPYLTLCP